MARQLFANYQGINNQIIGTNVCLFYGQSQDRLPDQHLHPTDARARMVYSRWPQDTHFVSVDARLYMPPLSPAFGKTKPFLICPELAVSFISEDVAGFFDLGNYFPRNINYPDPHANLFGIHNVPIQISGYHEARFTIPVFSVRPSLQTRTCRFYRLIGDNIPENTAIIGRNVLRYLLLLYRAGGSHGNLEQGHDRLAYIGIDNGEIDRDLPCE